MSFLKCFKIVLLLNVINSCSSSSLLESGNIKTDLVFKKLETCLTSERVDNKNLFYRDSGNKYTELNWQWNTLNGILKPMAYLVVNKVSDIKSAIKCCRSMKIRIVARSGGHSYAKNGFGDSNSLVLDLTNLNEISTNDEMMKCSIGAGARNGFVISTLSERNFFIPVGICPTVGIAGLALGGGYGYFTRLYGLTSDNLLELEMVDAEGNLLIVNSTDADLFFALRGVGGGSYGIVTKLTFKMYPEPDSVMHAVINFNFKTDFLTFFETWQSLITFDIPKNFGTIVVMSEDNIKMELFYINRPNSSKSASEILQILNSFSFPFAKNRSFSKLSYADFVLTTSSMYSNKSLEHISDLANIIRHNKVGWKKAKSMYVDKVLDGNEIKKLYHLLDAALQTSTTSIVFLQNGGAINDFSRSETAFVHRGNLYDIQLEAFTYEGEDERNKADLAIKTFYEESKSIFNHRESYQNYLDQDIGPDYLERYYGENLERLIDVKNRIDPDNIFYHGQSIPTKFGHVV